MRIYKFPNRRAQLAAACLFLIGCCVRPALGQSVRIDGGVVSQERFGFYWETRLSPGTPPLSDSFTTRTTEEPGVIHRILLDRAGRVFVGYTVRITVLTESPNIYQVRFERLAMTSEMSRRVMGDDASSWRQLPQSQWGPPAPQNIRGGDVLQLNLLTSAATGQWVIDYVTVQEPSRRSIGFTPVPERRFSFAPGPSRDFRTDDVELTIEAPRLTINGKLDPSTAKRFDDVSGGVVWIYTGRRGRYILSLVPRPELGFRRAGEIRGSSLSFIMGNEEFKLSSGARIAPGQAAFNLYVLHDPDWKPTYPNADLDAFIMGAADRPEALLRK